MAATAPADMADASGAPVPRGGAPGAPADEAAGALLLATRASSMRGAFDSGSDSSSDPEFLARASGILLGLLGALVVVLLALVVYAYAKRNRTTSGPARLAKKVAAAGWVLYTRRGCGYCTKQLHALGSAYSPRVRCDAPPAGSASGSDSDAAPSSRPVCGDPSIEGFPFWFNERTGATRVGLQSGAALLAMTA